MDGADARTEEQRAVVAKGDTGHHVFLGVVGPGDTTVGAVDGMEIPGGNIPAEDRAAPIDRRLADGAEAVASKRPPLFTGDGIQRHEPVAVVADVNRAVGPDGRQTATDPQRPRPSLSPAG